MMDLFVSPDLGGRGRYGQLGGRITVWVVDDKSLFGRWREDNGATECENGEYFGRVLIEPDDIDRFVGYAWNCDDVSNRDGPWNGVLIAGTPWFNHDVWIGPDVRRRELDDRDEQGLFLMHRAFGSLFDPDASRSQAADMTCDGGIDRVYFWSGPADDPRPRISVAFNQLPLYVGEDVSATDTIVVDKYDTKGLINCEVASIDKFALVEFDRAALKQTGFPSLAPTCTHIVTVGEGNGCRIHWDLETNRFSAE